MATHMNFNLLLIVLLVTYLSPDGFSQRSVSKTETATEVIRTNVEGSGNALTFRVTAGKEHNHPMMAAWIENKDGSFIQTLYVNQSVAKGYFNYADKSEGKWKPGELVRPASLPVWAHKRGIRADEGHYMPTKSNPVPDAFTSATPSGDFVLAAKTDAIIKEKFHVFFEFNQSWDWNEYWTNSKFGDDTDYKSSAQPSVVYSVEIDPENLQESYLMRPVGHGHPTGKDGSLNNDLSTITTALRIFDKIEVVVDTGK
jgi:hypothetical protein